MNLVLARWHIALVIYLVIVAAIILGRPAIMFDAEGNVKPWGVNTDAGQSIFSVQMVFPLLAIILYYIVVVTEMSMTA